MDKSGPTQTEATELLSLLSDSDCRDILEATAAKPMSVSELVEACDVPTSTAYRKVEALVEAGLLGERGRIQPERRNPNEYILRAGTISLTIDESGELHIDREADSSDRVEGRSIFDEKISTQPQISTDGGENLDDTADAR